MSVDRLVHPALELGHGRRLLKAPLSDRARVGVVLQATALAAHLDRVGWRLEENFERATVDPDGTLRGVEVLPRGGRRSVQSVARRLLRDLFGGGEISGRGEARRIARDLLARWGGVLVPLPPDRVVEDLLEAAPFLWGGRWAAARRSLAAGVVENGQERPWICGPDRFRRRLLAHGETLADVHTLLGSPSVQSLWRAEAEAVDPVEAWKAGRWQAAATAWGSHPPTSAEHRVAWASSLLALGRFSGALVALDGVETEGALVLAGWCRVYLNEYAVAEKIVARLRLERLTGDEVVEAAGLVALVSANRGRPERAISWTDAAASVLPDRLRWRLELVRAAAAWDQRDLDAMVDHLDAAIPGRDDPSDGWRWYRAQALLAMARGDGADLEAALRKVLGRWRRVMPRYEAAGTWNDLAIGRVLRDDLAGAERACGHAARLHARCDGERGVLLSQRNLAEVRIRRGRTRGVSELLERSLTTNLLAGHMRAAAEDAALWARLELVEGRPAAAVATCRLARERAQAKGSTWHLDELAVVEGRALGWEGAAEDVAAVLEGASDAAVLAMLEAEERPALWALAGDRERALEGVTGPVAPLWRLALGGRDATGSDWSVLDGLDPYRAARAVWDLELVAPGIVPSRRVRRAVGVLRQVGARRLAERLERRVGGPWEALDHVLRLPAVTTDDLRELVDGLGHPDARLVRRTAVREETLVDGTGGDQEIVVSLPDGDLLLVQDPEASPVLEAAMRAVSGLLPPSGESGSTPEGIIPGIVGRSEALSRALARLRPLAAGEMPILVFGESGTGKELVARQIHRLSARSSGTLAPLNCAALSENLALSELFGHVRGAFTGADRDHAGIFEVARGGTVFLDEIGDLPASAQGMLLRVVQEGEVRRLGESLPRRVDFRIVTATHRDLETMVREGTFRQDLYYRLRVGVIELPPLRERGDDVVLIARHLLRRLARGGRPAVLAASALDALRAHEWPGNVRELQNCLEVAVALGDGGEIEVTHLGFDRRPPAARGTYHEEVDRTRRELVRDALRAAAGNRAAAARELGLTRQALAYLVKKLSIVESR